MAGLMQLSAAPDGVSLRVVPAQLNLGQKFTLDLNARQGGVLRILTVDDQPDAKLSLIFPNPHDQRDAVAPGTAVKVPRTSQWSLVAQPPRGRAWMIAIVAPSAPSAGSFKPLSLQQAVQAFSDGQPQRLLGLPDCPAASACRSEVAVQAAEFTIR